MTPYEMGSNGRHGDAEMRHLDSPSRKDQLPIAPWRSTLVVARHIARGHALPGAAHIQQLRKAHLLSETDTEQPL